MSNSPLVNYTKISPNRTSPRNHKIDTITIHCVVGQCSVESLGALFADPARKGSSNYGIGYDGKIGLYVEEKDRSWCSGGKDKNGKPILVNGISGGDNDHRAITIEVASDATHPYAVTQKAYDSLIKLLVDICKRNNIKELKWKGNKSLVGNIAQQNMTVHRWFANKACPGDYLYSRHGQIANAVNAQLGVKTESPVYRVQTGSFSVKSKAEAEYYRVSDAGFKPNLVKSGSVYKIQVGAYKNKANADSMAKRLKKAGFKADVTTASGTTVKVSARVTKKTIDQVAREVIANKWGSGVTRKTLLTKAGYDYNAVQKRVNELMRV